MTVNNVITALEALIAPIPKSVLQTEINSLSDQHLLFRRGDFEVYLASAEQIPNLLKEIGRLRELTFRTVGEGTGKAMDVDHISVIGYKKANRGNITGAINQWDTLVPKGSDSVDSRDLWRRPANGLSIVTVNATSTNNLLRLHVGASGVHTVDCLKHWVFLVLFGGCSEKLAHARRAHVGIAQFTLEEEVTLPIHRHLPNELFVVVGSAMHLIRGTIVADRVTHP